MKSLADWLEFQQRQHPLDIALGLDRISAVAERLALPRPAPHVITVGGTNGKGSTVAFLDAILRASGYQVGTYTSPHVLRYNERVRVDGVEAADDELVAAFERIEAARGGTALTYFEFGTLAALIVFAQRRIDVAVLEVGLGGRLDAVNLVEADAAIVTTVDLDHLEYLGDDKEAIGFEKAGIFRAGRPAIVADPEPPRTLVDHAHAIGADLEIIGHDFGALEHAASTPTTAYLPPRCSYLPPRCSGRAGEGLGDTGQSPEQEPTEGRIPVRAGEGLGDTGQSPEQEPTEGRILDWGWWHRDGTSLVLPRPILAAPAQLGNAAAAIAALHALRDRLPVARAALVHGVASAWVPARLQRFPGPVEIIVDVGHNPQAARELARWLDRSPIAGRTFAVFATLGDKDIAGIVAPLADCVTHWFFAGLADESPRGVSSAEMARRTASTLPAQRVELHERVVDALAAARAAAVPGDRILVFGSFHTAATALNALLHSG